jgi:hypothetical protein
MFAFSPSATSAARKLSGVAGYDAENAHGWLLVQAAWQATTRRTRLSAVGSGGVATRAAAGCAASKYGLAGGVTAAQLSRISGMGLGRGEARKGTPAMKQLARSRSALSRGFCRNRRQSQSAGRTRCYALRRSCRLDRPALRGSARRLRGRLRAVGSTGTPGRRWSSHRRLSGTPRRIMLDVTLNSKGSLQSAQCEHTRNSGTRRSSRVKWGRLSTISYLCPRR